MDNGTGSALLEERNDEQAFDQDSLTSSLSSGGEIADRQDLSPARATAASVARPSIASANPNTAAAKAIEDAILKPKTSARRFSAQTANYLLDGCELIVLGVVISAIGIAYLGADMFFGRPDFLGGTVFLLATYTVIAKSAQQHAIATVYSTDLPGRMRSLSLAFLCVIVAAFVFKVGSQYSRVWIGASYLSGLVVLTVWGRLRSSILQRMVKSGKVAYSALIYGNNPRTQELINNLSGACDHLDLRAVVDSRETRITDLPVPTKTGIHFDDIVSQLRSEPVDAIIIDLPQDAVERIREIERALEAVNVDILMAPSSCQLAFDDCKVANFGHLPTVALYTRPIQGAGSLLKIAIDRVGASVFLACLSPLMLLTALLIKLESKGPVFFRQPRTGFNNAPFEMLKFRSMRTDMTDVAGTMSTQRDDPRITRVGRFIRRFSIDELPQLINVLKGDMSLVGPRPHAFGSTAGERHFDDIVQRYAARHRVLPGLTGLAQVRGFRGNTEREEDIMNRVDSDLEYIRRWSVWLDLEILLRTAIVLFWQKNAY